MADYSLENPGRLTNWGHGVLKQLSEEADVASQYTNEHIKTTEGESFGIFATFVEQLTTTTQSLNDVSSALVRLMRDSANEIKAAGEEYEAVDESNAAELDSSYSPEYDFTSGRD
ncbi:hypothetical protein LZ318_36855 [Saccharopolyspora indica]|uniref:hypothetical protein n=1 Tax=Saccharopolyspora indica TaxID=1229659 RepID=UPI0022EB476A|nr:hypothetical protein [Saccharopolyspora indica]MDA3647728.1 hypothetical protein [Saccharopolyspora indica]